MRLHRLAIVELRPGPRYLRRWNWEHTGEEGVQVGIRAFNGPEDLTDQADPAHGLTFGWGRVTQEAPGSVLLGAELSVSLDLDGPNLNLESSLTLPADRALREAADVLAITSQASHEVYSPRPYLFFEPESASEQQQLGRLERINLPPLGPGVPRLAPGSHLNIDFRTLLADRPTGVALLGAALSAGKGISKLHELMRVFENAFACGGARLLVDPLTDFLKSYPWALGYTRDEVRSWIAELRHPATHADLKQARRVLLDPDIEPYLPRVEQAAYDVLFNKKNWHSRSSERLDRWHFKSMIKRDGSAIVSEGGELQAYDPWDHMRAFRLKESIRVDTDVVPNEWRAVDWYFARPDDA